MIEINDRFSIKRMPDCWILYDTTPTINPKTNEPGLKTRKSYYPRLGQVATKKRKETIANFTEDITTTDRGCGERTIQANQWTWIGYIVR